MIVAGVAAWLWEGPAAGGRALAVALLISLVMLSELGLLRSEAYPGRTAHDGSATGCGLGSFWLSAGFSHGLDPHRGPRSRRCSDAELALGTGCKRHGRGWARFSGDVGWRRGSLPVLLPAVFLMTSAAALGRRAALRLEERCQHQRVVAELEDAQARLCMGPAAARELARAEEHRRLSEELHDALGMLSSAPSCRCSLRESWSKATRMPPTSVWNWWKRACGRTLERVRHAAFAGASGASRRLPLHLALESPWPRSFAFPAGPR